MAHPTFDHAREAALPVEVRVEREGPGHRRWRWSLWRGDTLLARSPAGFAGAEEAYQAGRMALAGPRPPAPSPAAPPRRR